MTDPLMSALRSERDAWAERAPAPDFAALLREVAERRERRLQRFLVLASAAPTALLFLGGVASLLVGGGLLSGLPLLGVALWLAVDGAVLPPLPAGERGRSEAVRGFRHSPE